MVKEERGYSVTPLFEQQLKLIWSRVDKQGGGGGEPLVRDAAAAAAAAVTINSLMMRRGAIKLLFFLFLFLSTAPLAHSIHKEEKKEHLGERERIGIRSASHKWSLSLGLFVSRFQQTGAKEFASR